MQVAIVDYGVGNLLSVQRALEFFGVQSVVTSDFESIISAKQVILPGVGAFGNAMEVLNSLGLVDILRQVIDNNTPFLGICLGMQLLFEESEEFGWHKGLGFLEGRVIGLPDKTKEDEILKIPHIGWNELNKPAGVNWTSTLLEHTQQGDAVYFVHSFMAAPKEQSTILAYTSYGGRPIPAVVKKGNVVGCQFHPEKSGAIGLEILRNFIRL
jgi:glutamine amidotransferase